MNKDVNTEVLVIGAGPGGYPAAIRAAQLGKKVILVEKEYIGGECLNFGCIPSKNLLSAAKIYHRTKNEIYDIGIITEKVELDFPKLQKWTAGISEKLVGGIKYLLKGNGIELIIGKARFLNNNQVEIKNNDNEITIISAQSIIIATGAEYIPSFEVSVDGEKILNPKDALSLTKVPDSILIDGGENQAIEIATIYAKFGSKITIVTDKTRIMSLIEKNMVNLIKKKLKKLGVIIFTNTVISSISASSTNENIEVFLNISEKTDTKIEIEKLITINRKKSSISDLNLDSLDKKISLTENGFIRVNDKQETNISNIYAVGDCTGSPFYAHKATKQGIIAAEIICKLPSASDFISMPGAIYTDPEIAFAGLSEKEAKEAGYDVNTGRISFASSGRALGKLEGEGFVKIISDKKTDVLLGIQIIGPNASDLISEASLALEMGATLEDLGYIVHPHPSLSESLMEAADAAKGKAIHLLNPVVKRKLS